MRRKESWDFEDRIHDRFIELFCIEEALQREQWGRRWPIRLRIGWSLQDIMSITASDADIHGYRGPSILHIAPTRSANHPIGTGQGEITNRNNSFLLFLRLCPYLLSISLIPHLMIEFFFAQPPQPYTWEISEYYQWKMAHKWGYNRFLSMVTRCFSCILEKQPGKQLRRYL